ncbi:MAG: hypothetical protein ABIR91_04395 [Candidatus Saccharimonadales bacterium]
MLDDFVSPESQDSARQSLATLIALRKCVDDAKADDVAFMVDSGVATFAGIVDVVRRGQSRVRIPQPGSPHESVSSEMAELVNDVLAPALADIVQSLQALWEGIRRAMADGKSTQSVVDTYIQAVAAVRADDVFRNLEAARVAIQDQVMVERFNAHKDAFGY